MRQRPFRPGFDHTVDAPPREVGGAVARLVDAGAPFTGRALDGHVMLTVLPGERHLWSPYLHLKFEPHRSEESAPEPRRTYVRGFFTPHPSLWSAFVFTYLALGTILAFASIWAFVEFTLDEEPVAAWVCGAAVLAALALHLFSRAGRTLAAEQMDRIHAEVERALAGTGRVSPGAG
ncbi:MAG: hypothetical protein R3F34_14140 [Planctomycetota bacterium]